MAPITSIFRRDGDDNFLQTGSTAYYLLVTFTILFLTGCMCLSTLAIFRRVHRGRQLRDLEQNTSSNKAHSRSRNTHSISITNEKSAFLDDGPPSPTDSVPEIRITFPDEPSSDGKRQSRIVIVKISEKGSVGYEPYQEPLPVYQEKESASFQSIDLERIGGLKEKHGKA